MGTSEKEIVEENWDLVSMVTLNTIKRYRFPSFLWEEIESSAALALWKAAEKYKPQNGTSSLRAWLTQQMYWDILDDVRTLSGRIGSAKAERGRDISLDAEYTTEGETTTMYDFLGEEYDPSNLLIADDTLQEILAVCTNDRQREAVIRTALGQTHLEIAGHLGVTESRISQILTRVRHLFQHGEVAKTCKSGSLIVNWR